MLLNSMTIYQINCLDKDIIIFLYTYTNILLMNNSITNNVRVKKINIIEDPKNDKVAFGQANSKPQLCHIRPPWYAWYAAW